MGDNFNGDNSNPAHVCIWGKEMRTHRKLTHAVKKESFGVYTHREVSIFSGWILRPSQAIDLWSEIIKFQKQMTFIQDVLGAFDVRYSLVGSPGKRCGGASSAWRIIDDLGHAHQSQSPNRQGHTFSRDSGEL